MKPTIYCPHCKGILNHHTPPTCPNCGKATGTDGLVDCKPYETIQLSPEALSAPQEVLDVMEDKVAELRPVTEHFTTDQMVSAIGQWLAFGEQMFNDGNQYGYFSGAGWAARALAAAREFIENTNEPE